MIDPVRCPLAYEEFRLKEFERDRDGTWVDEIPDGNDHSIDAVRYAVMDDVLRGAQGAIDRCPSRPCVRSDCNESQSRGNPPCASTSSYASIDVLVW